MQPLTFSSNKHFIPVANKPLIFYPIEAITEVGIKEVLITYNPGWLDTVKNFLGDGSRWGLKLTYVLQPEPKGLANIIQVCEEGLGGESFVLHLGDNIFSDGIKDLYDFFVKEKPNGLVAMVRHPENRRMGVPYFDKKGSVKKIVEKPKNPPHDYAMPGIYFADNNFFKAFKGKGKVKPSARGEYEIPDPFTWLIKHGYKVLVKEYEGRWLDPGKFDDWIGANQYLLDKSLQTKIESRLGRNAFVENRVSIGKRCKIYNSRIRGPVAIGDGVVIKDSYIGPYTSIGSNCEIIGSHIENSVLMNEVKVVGIKQPIDTSLIGTGAEIVNGKGPTAAMEFFIGEKSHIVV